jgi:hypothetical protein
MYKFITIKILKIYDHEIQLIQKSETNNFI